MRNGKDSLLKSQLKVYGRVLNTLLRESPAALFLILFIALFDGLAPTINLLFLREIIDIVINTEVNNALPQFGVTVGIWLLVVVFQYSVSSINVMLMEFTVNKSVKNISMAVMKKSLSFQGIGQFESQDYQSNANWLNYVEAPVSTFVYELSDMVKYCFQFASVFVIFAVFKAWVPIALIISIIPGVIASKLRADAKSKQQESVNEFERTVSYYRGLTISANAAKEFRVFSFDKLLGNKNSELFMKIEREKNEFSKRNFKGDVFGTVARVVVASFVFIIIAIRARNGEISPGSLVLYFQSIFQFSSSLLQILTLWSFTRVCYDFYSRYFSFLKMEDLLEVQKGLPKIEDSIDEIKFESVSFAYPSGQIALHDLSFVLKKGDIVALVGENGAGKTTIVKLLLRLYDPTKGKITINGRDIKNIDLASYRERVSAVFQDYNKYELTLSENIFADGRNVEERLRELLAVLPNDFIAKLPHGAATQLGTSFGGIDLSGGQWQRVAILRGMAKVHDVFLVDEPTASIDPIEEANVFESIGKQKCNITILVTHRLGSIRKATKILVIKDGGLIAEGGHELLINECEYYEKMYKSQAEMYDEKGKNNDEAVGV